MTAIEGPSRLVLTAALACCAFLGCISMELSLADTSSSQEGAITWRPYSPAAFRAAQAADRPILLVLEVPWSSAARSADKQLWSDPTLRRIVSENYIALRERADLRPDLARRYPVNGWPAINLLLPDGSAMYYQSEKVPEPFRMSRGQLSREEMTLFLREGARYYHAQRTKVIALAREKERALGGAVRPERGTPNQELAWSVGHRMALAFDREQRYFGGPPRLPQPDLLELFYTFSPVSEERWQVLADTALETFIDKLRDPADGGIYRMALGADWSQPQKEKLLDVNARTLDLLTLAYRRSANGKWRRRALSLAGFLVERLGKPDGSFAAARCESCPGGRDETALSGANGLAAAALIRAGAGCADKKTLSRGLEAARWLLATRYHPGQPVPRVSVIGGRRQRPPVQLEDQVGVATAFLTAWEATGDRSFLEAAREIARTTLSRLRDPDTGALRDTPATPSGPLPLRRAEFPLELNAAMVRVLVRVHFYTGNKEPLFRRAARGLLEAFTGSHQRVKILAPSYALASFEYFARPMIAIVAGPKGDPKADALRIGALASDDPFTIVISLTNEDNRDAILAAGLSLQTSSGLYPFYDGLGGQRMSDPGAVRGSLYDLRLLRQAQLKAAAGKDKIMMPTKVKTR